MGKLLDLIDSPKDVKMLSPAERKTLCAELREQLVDVVSETGGHLASNLGAVELTVALHSVFDCPQDTFIFDVGHQCYTHKLLTGRRAQFDTLRREGGISGFPRPSESKYDSFIEGHASTSISQAVGIARAKLLRGDDSKTIAVIGDGAFTGGLAYEAINSLSDEYKNLIVVLNDNSMSISKSVGALSKYLMRLRTDRGYVEFKASVKNALDHTPVIGRPIAGLMVRAKTALRRNLFGGTFFEEFGFNYIGPVDGHDLDELCFIFSQLKATHSGPAFVHIITQKGKGYGPAEVNPGAYHGVGKFDLERGNPDISLADSFSNTFGRKLSELAGRDERVCAITAAMKYGTGLQYFYHAHKERFFDVGIAEQHAVTMGAGLAKGGMKPIFCVYSTFLQRSADQLIHDISLDDVDFMLGIDRAGFVGDDGETHQGLFDAAMLSSIGRFRVASPANYRELIGWLSRLLPESGPRAIRYPRGKEDARIADHPDSGEPFDLIRGEGEARLLFVTYGREFAEVQGAVRLLQAEGIAADVLKLNLIAPIDCKAIELASCYPQLLFAEEGIAAGGIGERFLDLLMQNGFRGGFRLRAVETNIIRQAPVARQIAAHRLDTASLFHEAKELLQ